MVWTRQLILVFGNTTQAVAAILTGFFGGMAIGSVLGGVIADRTRRSLWLYACLELVLAVLVLVTPVAFRAMHEVYRGAFGSLEGQPQILTLVRFSLALLVLGPATVLMGATLPTLSRYLARDRGELGTAFGSLYAANTVGAIIGAAAAGWVLIELLGLTATLVCGAACSVVAGVAALLLGRTYGEHPPISDTVESATGGRTDRADAAMTAAAAEPQRSARPRQALAVAFVSGLTSLGYQSLWTRLLASGTGNSTYVFTTILVIFLIGLALGAIVYARRLSRARHPITILAAAQLVLALLVIGGMAVSTRAIFRSAPLAVDALLVVLPATLVMGIVFPMSSILVSRSDTRIGTDSGLLLGANTLGAITGTFIVPFLFIPLLTSPRVVVLLAAVNAMTGLALFLSVRGRAPQRIMGAAAGVTIAALAIGLVLVPNRLIVDPGERLLRASRGTVTESAEDEIAAVVSGRYANGRWGLWVTGTGMTALTVDARLMPDLPLIARPSAKSILVIAFGMGSSFRTSLIGGLTTDAVELVPSVPKMFHHYYDDASEALTNPKGRVIISDGRNHVELTSRTYDLIMVDPPPPIHSSGTAVLYSREFYVASKGRLNPDGLMMEWMPYGQSLDEFRAQVRTFADVFPNVLLAFSPANHGVFMLGSDGAVALRDDAIREVLARPGVADDLSNAPDARTKGAGGWARLIPTLVWLQGEGVMRFAGAGPLITDDRPYTEYFLLRETFGPKSPRMTKQTVLAASR